MKRSASLLLVVLAALLFSSPAQAYDYYSYGFPWFGYGNQGPAAYALGNIPAPPYFALHPPVYYSHPIARPYGHSPFACPSVCHHDRVRPEPRVVMNPFIELKSPDPETKKEASVAAVPLRIANPFYPPADKTEQKLAGK